MAGFVYVMTNGAFPHLVKIGKSSKDPRQDRVNELSHTGVPQPFRVEYYAFVEDESTIERWLHKYFEAHRPNKAREFFQIGVAEAIVAVRDAANLMGGIKYEEVFYVSPRELEERKQEQVRLREEQQRAEQRAAEERRRQELERVAAEERRRQAAAAEQAQHERGVKAARRALLIFIIIFSSLFFLPDWLTAGVILISFLILLASLIIYLAVHALRSIHRFGTTTATAASSQDGHSAVEHPAQVHAQRCLKSKRCEDPTLLGEHPPFTWP